MSKKTRQPSNEETSWALESKLEPGMLRFMANVIDNGLNTGLRTEADFIRHFSPADIMMGLAERPDLRANILVATTGVHAKIAHKKSAASAGEDLQIALDEGETDPAVIISLFHADDRVRYLDKARLWDYVVEPKFWKIDKNQGDLYEGAKAHVAFIMDRAIEDRMLTHREIVEGISVAEMVKLLPLTELQALIERALSNSHAGKPFTEQDMLRAVPSRELVEHVPLPLLWESVVVPKIAERNGLIEIATGSSYGTANKTTSSSGEELIGTPGNTTGRGSNGPATPGNSPTRDTSVHYSGM